MRIRGKVEKIVNNGLGLIRNKDMGVIFIPLALKGELLEVELTKRGKSFSYGEIRKILEPSPERIDPICPHFGECGGCHFLNTTYQNEIIIKIEILKDLWRKKLDKIEVIKSPRELNYRIRARFHVENGLLGFFKRKTNTLISISNCPLLHERINDSLPFLKNSENFQKIKEITVITNGSEILTDPPIKNSSKRYLELNLERFTNIISPHTFSQANPYAIKAFLPELKKLLEKEDRILEFHAGNGLFSVELAKSTQYVASVESNPISKEFFFLNMKKNKIVNFKFYSTTDKKWIRKYSKREVQFNKIFLDPPRSGISPWLRNYILNSKFEKIFYLSCNISTQKRDVESFLKRGYKIEKVFILDFFPRTYHVESFFVLSK